EYGVVWQDDRDGNNEIYFARLNSSGAKIGPDVRVTNAPGSSRTPAVVWTGWEYGVVWYDDRDGNTEIYFARLDGSGVKISPDVRVTNDPASSSFPAVVWTGSEYGVAWQDTRNDDGVYFARLDSEGVKVGGERS